MRAEKAQSHAPWAYPAAGPTRLRSEIDAFASDLAASREASIDAFLHSRRQNEDYLAIGRLAVWIIILDAEKKALGRDLSGYWLYRFMDDFLEDASRPEDLDRYGPDGAIQFLHGLAIHTLNYDRLSEHILSTWVKHQFPTLDLRSNNYLPSLNPGGVVRHQHGSLGPIFESDGQRAVPFGCEPPDDPSQLLEAASKLQFWFEPNNRPQAYDITNRMVELRGVHVVTGFGYHEHISSRFRQWFSRDAKIKRVIATSHKDCRKKADEWLQKTYASNGIELHHLEDKATCRTAAKSLFSDWEAPPQ